MKSSNWRRKDETDAYRGLLEIGNGGRGRKLRYQLLHLLKHFDIQGFRLVLHFSVLQFNVPQFHVLSFLVRHFQRPGPVLD